MTVSTTSVLVVVKRRLLEVFRDRAGLAEVQVEYAEPGKLARKECLFFGETTGSHDISAIVAGRKPRDEMLEIELYLYSQLAGRKGPEDAEARVMELLAEVEDTLAEDPHIGLVPGLQVQWVRMGALKRIDCGSLENGANAVAVVSVVVKARLS